MGWVSLTIRVSENTLTFFLCSKQVLFPGGLWPLRAAPAYSGRERTHLPRAPTSHFIAKTLPQLREGGTVIVILLMRKLSSERLNKSPFWKAGTWIQTRESLVPEPFVTVPKALVLDSLLFCSVA